MSMQSLTEFKFITRIHFSLALEPAARHEPIRASSCDYGFDFDEEDLAQALLASVPASTLDRPAPTVEADDFELLYRWFNS